MASLQNAAQASPFSLGVNADFDIDDASKEAMKNLPPELQVIAKRGLQAIKDGKVDPSDPRLATLGQQALAPKPAPLPNGPYGVPGAQIGPETATQASNEQLAAQAAQKAQQNEQYVAAQAGGSPFTGRLPLETPVAPMSGLSTHDKLVDSSLKKLTDVRPQGMAPEEVAAQGAAISNIPIVKRAQEGLDRQENQLSMMMQRPQSPLNGDLGGFLAMGNKGWGADLAEGYHAPMTQMQQQASVAALMQKIQSDRQALATNVVQGIRATKGGTLGDILQANNTLTQQQGAVDPMGAQGAARMDRNFRAFSTGVKSDMKELNDANAATQEAQRMLSSHTSVLDTTFRDKFLKAMIGGRVTNYDLMRQSGDQGLADRAEQIMNTMTEGTFSPKNRAEYEDALRIIQEANSHEAQARLNDWHEAGLGGFGLPEDRVQAGLKVGHGSNFAPLPESTLKQSRAKTVKAVPDVQDMVRVQGPDGRTYQMPAANVKKAAAAGYKVIQ